MDIDPTTPEFTRSVGADPPLDRLRMTPVSAKARCAMTGMKAN
jgi:hypothetical protein